ncbi:nucleoside ABC transporter membrane protein [Caloramator quimbayensis]|uniref:Nucleoside ABC transporter membrane protein n=1 Tax=Caloramator quimbayensis TaxID=1147123 RepID=A0A1T4WL21_9CLOT|nr:ABC transporter permease [Caloramator quimbayensis]SKA77351.1 nucleoside ABC transporter membrane protein [Caloramator quimbayensis]
MVNQVRFVRRDKVDKYTNIKVKLISIVAAFFIMSLFLIMLKINPKDAFIGMIKGAFGSPLRIRQTTIKAVPLIITSLGILTAFKMKFWNIGGEGQILMGAFGASILALFYNGFNSTTLLLLMALSAAVFGGLYALISAVLKIYFKTNETIVTLMLNYIALKFITYLQYGPWKDKKALGFPKIANFPDKALLPNLLGVNVGWIIALILIILVYIFMNHTKKGYEIAIIGESINTARYAGINIKAVTILCVFLSGALCGITGFIQSSGVNGTLSVEIAGGVGYTAIIIAYLSNLKEPFILIVSVLFAALLQGSSYIETSLKIPNSAALILQSLILFCILSSEIFTTYRLKFKD